MTYKDISYASSDGLTLYARDYGPVQAPVILCLHALTRNSADFEILAPHLASHYRVICPDQRGRGRSDYSPNPQLYRPDVYAQDMIELIRHLKLERVTIIGTSLGGLMAMIMAAFIGHNIKTVILNDIGPEIDPIGLARIQSYVGNKASFSSWKDAAQAVKKTNGIIFPDYNEAAWIAFAKRCCIERGGEIVFNYDPAISENVKAPQSNAAPPDLWPIFEAMTGIPILVIRGETSDLLSPSIVARMESSHPNCRAVTIPNIGHAPMLDEAEALGAIDTFLAENS